MEVDELRLQDLANSWAKAKFHELVKREIERHRLLMVFGLRIISHYMKKKIIVGRYSDKIITRGYRSGRCRFKD